ncbi:MAG TPA: cyclic nucleotide-binding domain-containing protein [Anaerolineaceae bacterium]|nr:cyclic nucleotide-binding domain-containing protein [Anaerolineaceae bacterium]
MNISKEKLLKALKGGIIFRDIPDNFIQWVIERSHILQFQEGDLIYEKGAAAERFFFVISGSAVLYVQEGEQQYLINGCQAGNYFGFEALSKRKMRLTNAKAESPLLTLAIPLRIVQKIAEQFPAFQVQFTLQLQSLEFLIKKPMNWLQNEEIVHYVNREHPLILITRVLKPIILSLAALTLAGVLFNANVITPAMLLWIGSCLGAFGIGWAVWNAFDWMNDYYVVTNQRVVFLQKIALIYDSRKETPLSAILSITKQIQLIGRFYQFGDVILRTFTGLVKFRNVAYVEAVSAIVEEQWLNHKEKIAEENQEDPEIYLQKRLLGQNGASQNNQAKQAEKPAEDILSSGYYPDLFSRILKLRIVEEDTIIYRTHWFVFIRKTILPFLGMVLSVIFLLAPAYGWFGLVAEGLGTYQSILIATGISMALWWIYAAVDWRNDYFLITPEQIVDVNRKPLGMEERRSAPVRNIQTIEYKRQSIFGLLFNFGTVFIRVGDVEFTFDYVPHPSYVQQEIYTRFQRIREGEKKENADLNNERLASWMDAYHRVIRTQMPTPEGEEGEQD